jgi:hypothetical protein
MDELLKQNLGVLIGQRPEDWIAGTIPFEIRVPSGDWRPYLVNEERQYADNVETNACVSFSMNNALEIQHKQQTGEEINFSDRQLAKTSGTNPDAGNYLYRVADEVRNNGLLLEEEWPFPSPLTKSEFYKDIPAETLAKRRRIQMNYEWINATKDELQHHLKQAPIQIIITKNSPNHAVVLVAIEGDTAYYFDSYPPYLKTINVGSIYPNALKPVYKAMNNEFIKIININGTIYFGVGVENADALIYFSKMYGKPVQVNPDGSIESDYTFTV